MYIDLLFLLLIVVFCIVGYIRGFINQVISVLMLLSVLFFAKPLADWLKYSTGWSWFQKAPMLVDWGIAAVMICLLWVGIGSIVNVLKKTPGVTPVDRWIGVCLGFVKGVLVILAVGVIYQTLPEDSRAQFDELHKNAKKSIFLSMSRGMISWDSVNNFDSLNEIQQKMSPQEIRLKVIKELSDDFPIETPTMKKSERPLPWRSSTQD